MRQKYTRRELIKIGSGVGLVSMGGLSVLAACAPTPSSPSVQQTQSGPETALQRIKREKKIRVGTANEAPWSFMGPDGKITGVDSAVLKAIYASIGVELDAVIVEFPALLPGLVANRFDVTTGMFIRPDRCQQASPSDPHGIALRGLVSKKGNPKNIHSYADVAKTPGVRLGDTVGSSSVAFEKAAGVPEDRLILFPDIPALFAGIRADRIDVAAASELTLRATLKELNDSNLELVQPFQQPLDQNGKLTVNYPGTFYRREDSDLREFHNSELAKLRSSGALLQAISSYGFTAQSIPGPDIKGLDLCK